MTCSKPVSRLFEHGGQCYQVFCVEGGFDVKDVSRPEHVLVVWINNYAGQFFFSLRLSILWIHVTGSDNFKVMFVYLRFLKSQNLSGIIESCDSFLILSYARNL